MVAFALRLREQQEPYHHHHHHHHLLIADLLLRHRFLTQSAVLARHVLRYPSRSPTPISRSAALTVDTIAFCHDIHSTVEVVQFSDRGRR